MRVLTVEEIGRVAGGSSKCSQGNNLGGISNPNSLGDDLIAIYEGLVAATSYVIERVANAL
ncbi:MAG: hypothetical protein WB812_00790 [Woeseiaceae bacterium]